ncbi:MAG TPA: hypothetical protein VGB52_12310 [Actinomycetota bacterium]
MPPETRWHVRYAESLDAGATFGAQVDVAGPIKGGAVCLSGLSCAGDREIGDFLQVAIHPDGRSMIPFVDTFDDASLPGVYLAAQASAGI